MREIWLLTSEVLVAPADMPSGATRGFVNVTTWAESVEVAREKLSKYQATFNWRLISIENAYPIADDDAHNDDLTDMIEQACANPNAIILGRFHSYRED